MEVVEENGIFIDVGNTKSSPKRNEILYNADMLINRSLSLCALYAYHDFHWTLSDPTKCIDASAATGVAGLAWALHFPQMSVCLNDPLPAAADRVKLNADKNNLNVEVTSEDINVLLHKRVFDFVFLDCYGSSVSYLDSLFRHVPKNGVIVITSTDDSALYGKAADVTLRNYGANITRTFYARELGTRLIIASVVRAAARYNKSVDVLCCVSVRSFFTVIVRVKRGASHANESIRKIRKLIHCCMCEDRAFCPPAMYSLENPSSLLSCDCRSKSCSQLAMDLGPVWSGELFYLPFCEAMLTFAKNLSGQNKLVGLLQTIIGEASMGASIPADNRCISSDKEECADEIGREKLDRSEEEDIREDESDTEKHATKRLKIDSPTIAPFYFNLHRYCPKGHDLSKVTKVVEWLQQSGFHACRTHFDPEAIRTDASLKEFSAVLLQFLQAGLTATKEEGK